MSIKYKFAVAALVIFGVVGLVHGKSSALTTTGYYGSRVNADWFCNVLGNPKYPHTSTDCITQTNPPRAYQDYALPNFSRTSAVCKDTDSKCLKSQIEQDIQSNLNGGSNLVRTGASYIINTMNGIPAGRGSRTISSTELNDWISRINNPAVTLKVERNYPFGTPTAEVSNTAYDEYTNDIIKYRDNGIGDVLIFYENGAVKYIIKLDCGNPIGDFSGLRSFNPVAVQCGTMRTDPQNIESTDRITVYATVTFSGGNPNPQPTNQSMSISGVGNVGVTVRQSSADTFTLQSDQFSVRSPGRYAVSWSVELDGVAPTPTDPCGGDLSSNTQSFDVFNYPYLNVSGGDVVAGANFVTAPGGPCGTINDRNAGITSWNKGAAGGYAGAGTQFGATAMSFIQDFITNKGNTNNTGGPDSLSFANEDAAGVSPDSDNPGSGRYGGFYNQGPCVDYWGDKPARGTDVSNPNGQSLNSLDGTYVHAGNLTINPSNIGDGTRLTIYVDGDVSIKGDIKYGGSANPSWNSTGDTPSFRLIVHGSIFIDANVGQLDGTYVAVPDNNYATAVNQYRSVNKGTISTCSSGFTVLDPSQAPVDPMLRACGRWPLVVNGSFAANQIFFLRTYGTMSGQAAEQFNFSPELWLAPQDSGSLDPAYKSIVGLPPVL